MASRPTLLLVEDNPADRRLVSRCLDEIGLDVDVEIATDAPQALERILDEDRRPPSVVLLDLSLPSGDGREILSTCRQHHRCAWVPFVVYTAALDEETVRDCYARGANAFIVKPQELAELQRAMEAVSVLFLQPTVEAARVG